jgi:hypothetical protein
VEDDGADETMAAATSAISRPRLDSRDIPTSYAGLYGQGGSHEDSDLLPFELSLNRNTDWLRGGWLLLSTYVSIILIFQCLFMVLDTRLSWTLTNAGHLVVTLVFLHWIKGSSPNADQGEMNAMTLWEQLQCTSGTDNAQRALLIVPTLICYAACHFSNYDVHLCEINILLWAVTIIAKLPFMNGVRILGINRTAGIDDDVFDSVRKDD